LDEVSGLNGEEEKNVWKRKVVSDVRKSWFFSQSDNADIGAGFDRLRIRNDNDPEEVKY
jgi:hypothetical protein